MKMAAVEQKRTFAVVLEPEEEGGFTVRVPSLPEIVTYGKDEGEALAMAEDAIRLVLEDCAARGEPVPKGEPPRILESAKSRSRWLHKSPASDPPSQRSHSCA
jgi:antitoxin HicB